MVGGCAASWLAAMIFVSWQTGLEILCGMLGPLAAAVISWVLAEKKYSRRPEALTTLMIVLFGAKLVFFAAYLTVMLRLLLLRPTQFVLSFTVYFVVLYLIEALYLRRLFWRGMPASR
jgi:hypothetical protein